jgi:hypothetical protein
VLLDECIKTQASSLRNKLLSQPQFSFGGFEQASSQLLAQFDQEAPRLVAKAKTELELSAAAANRSASKGGSNITIHGPVGLIQTGDGSQASVHQHIDAGVKNQLAPALNFKLYFVLNGETARRAEQSHGRSRHPARPRAGGNSRDEQKDSPIDWRGSLLWLHPDA